MRMVHLFIFLESGINHHRFKRLSTDLPFGYHPLLRMPVLQPPIDIRTSGPSTDQIPDCFSEWGGKTKRMHRALSITKPLWIKL
ncbi:hypothetical protein BCR43DRAFT_496631 [Syncephalastrum racemosum]|uniref:Uncharacterized protein n=1 Tax=Syncephalastrum racemosum TaxID=13706 RepID=A0A1X2H4H9_SYNRA|nr:hypothetical protein BCR43DRAFT_496631 [Syncephalastrum racemosum]